MVVVNFHLLQRHSGNIHVFDNNLRTASAGSYACIGLGLYVEAHHPALNRYPGPSHQCHTCIIVYNTSCVK